MPIVVLATTKTGNNFIIYSMVTEKFKTRKKFTALLAFIAIFFRRVHFNIKIDNCYIYCQFDVYTSRHRPSGQMHTFY